MKQNLSSNPSEDEGLAGTKLVFFVHLEFFLTLSFLKIIIFQISSKLLISLFVGSALFLDLPSFRRTISCRLGPDKKKALELWAAKSLNQASFTGRIPLLSGLQWWLLTAQLAKT